MSRAETLFVSDLHLSAGRLAATRRFLRFLRHRAVGSDALYILGDLFDAWVGDDDFTPPNKAILRALHHLSQRGTRVYFQHGNRDFLIGERFAESAGLTLLPDYAVIDLYGTPTLLCHGDLLCTDDVPYQQFRAKTRDPAWRADVLGKPLPIRLLAARWYRIRSYWHKSKKSDDIMDVNPTAVQEALRRSSATRLIHGHTHRPAVHDLHVEDRKAQRLVLAPWEKQGSVLCWNATGYRWEQV